MSPKGEAGRGRERLSERAIVDAALALIDDDGVNAVSMRRLGDRLGVQPMAFYHHFPNKDALMDRVSDEVMATIQLPPLDLDWEIWTRQFLHNTKDALIAHPNRVDLILTRPGTGVDYANMFGAFVGTLAKEDVDGGFIHTAWHLVISYMLGYLQQFHASVRTFPREVAAVGPAGNLVAMADQIATCDDDIEFDRGLELIIESMRNRVESRSVPAA